MSTLKWVKCQDSLQQVRPTPEGRLSVKQIASKFGLNVDSIKFNSILETYDSNGFTTEVIRGGQAEDSAIIVTGRLAAGKSYAAEVSLSRAAWVVRPSAPFAARWSTSKLSLHLSWNLVGIRRLPLAATPAERSLNIAFSARFSAWCNRCRHCCAGAGRA